MKIFKTFNEFEEAAPIELADYIFALEKNSNITGEELFMDYYGGYLNIVETIEDLKEIPTTHLVEDPEPRWANILEEADSYDLCRWLEDGRWVEIMMCTTDAGGATYFVPREIALQVPNVISSIELSKEFWKNADKEKVNIDR
jgi:hypothetical protein